MPQDWTAVLLDEEPEQQEAPDFTDILLGETQVGPTLGEFGQQAAGSFVRGVAEIPAGLTEMGGLIGELWQKHPVAGPVLRFMGLEPDEARKQSHGYAQAIRKWTNEAIPPVADLQDDFWATDLPMALGSMTGFVAGGYAAGAAKLPRVLTLMGMGAALNGATGYYDTLYTFDDPDSEEAQAAAWKSLTLNAVVGTSEAISVSRMLNRLNKASGGGVKRALIDAVIEGGEEWGQEAGQQFWGNVVHEWTTDEDIDLAEGVVRGGNAGGLAGVLLSFFVSGARRMRARREGQEPPPGEIEAPTDVGPLKEEVPAERRLIAPPEGQKEIAPEVVEKAEASLREQGEVLGVPEEEVEDALRLVRVSGQPEAEVQRILGEWAAEGATPAVTPEKPRKTPTKPPEKPPEAAAKPKPEERFKAPEEEPVLVLHTKEGAQIRERLVEISQEMAKLERLGRVAKLPKTKAKHKAAQVALHEERLRLGKELKQPATAPVEGAEPAALPQEEALFGKQGKPPAPRKEGAPERGRQAIFFGGEKASKGQVEMETLIDEGKLGTIPAKKATPAQAGSKGLREWIRTAGGLALAAETERYTREEMGEFRTVERKDKRSGKLVKSRVASRAQPITKPKGKGGLSVDAAAELAWDAGFFAERPDINEFLEALEQDIPLIEDIAARGREAEEEARAEREAIVTEMKEEADIEDVAAAGVPFDPAEYPAEMLTQMPVDPIAHGGVQAGVPIGGRLMGRLETPPEPEKGKPVSAPQIIHALSLVLKAAGGKTPIRWGRMGRMKARGIFKVEPEVIRVKTANNVATAAHEVGHALEKHIYGWKKGGAWKKPLVRRKLQQELVKLGKDLYGKQEPAAGYKREGFAEFIRLFVSHPSRARLKAPQFSRWFDHDFLPGNPEVRDALLEVRRLVSRWADQGSLERARQSMVFPASWGERLKRGTAAVRRHFSMEAWVETGQVLYEFAREAEKRLGRELEAAEDPFFSMSALRTGHAARAAYMVEFGMIDFNGNKVGPPLVEIRSLIKGRYQDFVIYLWAKRAMALWTDPKRPARNPGLSLADAQQVVSELEDDRFELAADKVYEWNEGVLSYAAQASPSFAAVVERIREIDPGYYVPLQREFDLMDSIWGEKGGGGGGGVVGGPGFVKRLRGSGRRIKDPFPTLIANAQRTLLQAHQRFVLDRVLQLQAVEGMGVFMEEVPRDDKRVASATIEGLIKEINQRAFAQTGEVFKLTGEPDPEAVGNLVADTLAFFQPAVTPKGQDPVLPVWNGDRLVWYQVDARLMRVLSGMDVYRMNRWMELFFGLPAQLFRAGTTGLRASFALITNPARDVQTQWVNTRTGAWAPQLLAEYFRHLVSGAVHKATGRRYRPPYLDAFMRLGGQMAQPLGQDIPHTARAARRLSQNVVIRILDPRNAFDFIRDLFQFPEAAARISELKLVAKEVGWEPGQPMTLDQSFRMLLAAKQVTTDFTAAGEYARVMNRIAPFHNAAIQGPRANIRAARRAPARFLFKGLELAAASLLLWWWNKDKEWYIELSSRTKAMYNLIPFSWQGREEVVMVPRAFEPGMIFGALPEMLADAWYRQEPQQARDWFDQFFKVATPNVMPVMLDEAIDQWQNRDRFWDTPIEPESEKRKPKPERYNEYTTEVAKLIGRIFNVSPRRVDHAIGGIFGGVGRDLAQLTRPDLGPDELVDIPVAGRLFRRGGAMGTRPKSIEQLYDKLEEYQTRQASDIQVETPRQRELRLQMEDAATTISSLGYARRQAKSVEDRRELLEAALAIARHAVEAERGGIVTRGRFRLARLRAERVEKRLKQAKTE